MNRLVITANPKSMRAYRLASKFQHDHFAFEATEIDLPVTAAKARQNQDEDHRRNEVAECINDLVAAETPEMWSLAAPKEFFSNLLPLLSVYAKKHLGGCRTDDLVRLPAKHIVQLFTPTNVAA